MAAPAAVSPLAPSLLLVAPPRRPSSRFPSRSSREAGRRSAVVAFAGPPVHGGGGSSGGSSGPRGTPAQEESNDNGFLPQEDLNYLWRLAAGSVGGAAIIKYGSAFLPEITSPNIFQALLMIGVPVSVSVLLLIKESASDSRQD